MTISRADLEQAVIASSQSGKTGFAVLYANGALEEIRTPDPPGFVVW
jgi:hypothetical protein